MSRHRIFARGGQPNGKGWRYGNTALVESARRADELAAAGDIAGVAVWSRIKSPQRTQVALDQVKRIVL